MEERMTLYELTGQYAALYQAAVDGDELPDELFDALRESQDAVETKVEACCRVLRNLEAERDGLKAEADRLAKRARYAANNADRLKDYMLTCLSDAGLPSVRAGVFTASVAQSPPALKLVEEDVPANFKRLVAEVDKAAVKAALERGEAVPGAALVRGTHLRIR